jgi:hypothetical protein
MAAAGRTPSAIPSPLPRLPSARSLDCWRDPPRREQGGHDSVQDRAIA